METLHKSQKDKNHDIWETITNHDQRLRNIPFFIDNDPIEISQD